MLECQPQRFAADGLLDLQVLLRVGDRRRADHLVAKAIAQLRLRQRKRNPAQDVRHPRLPHHVADRVGHAQIRGDRPVEGAVEHAEHIRRCAADVHGQHVQRALLRDRLDHPADRVRR